MSDYKLINSPYQGSGVVPTTGLGLTSIQMQKLIIKNISDSELALLILRFSNDPNILKVLLSIREADEWYYDYDFNQNNSK